MPVAIIKITQISSSGFYADTVYGIKFVSYIVGGESVRRGTPIAGQNHVYRRYMYGAVLELNFSSDVFSSKSNKSLDLWRTLVHHSLKIYHLNHLSLYNSFALLYR